VQNKPEVFFHPNKPCNIIEIAGQERAMLYPMNHPDTYNVSNHKEVLTSKVIDSMELDGNIVYVETMNTIYRIGKIDD
jgi:hypothetical protein